MSKPDVLVLGKQLPSLSVGISDFATVHKLEKNSIETLLPELASKIRGVATSSFVGFPSELFDKLPNLEIIGNFGVGVDSIG